MYVHTHVYSLLSICLLDMFMDIVSRLNYNIILIPGRCEFFSAKQSPAACSSLSKGEVHYLFEDILMWTQ